MLARQWAELTATAHYGEIFQDLRLWYQSGGFFMTFQGRERASPSKGGSAELKSLEPSSVTQLPVWVMGSIPTAQPWLLGQVSSSSAELPCGSSACCNTFFLSWLCINARFEQRRPTQNAFGAKVV